MVQCSSNQSLVQLTGFLNTPTAGQSSSVSHLVGTIMKEGNKIMLLKWDIAQSKYPNQ
jgi:hypothetical protein